MRKKARVVQICGTGSGVGKSVLVAGLCRVFQQQGYRVAPFKAQNMALNSAVTRDGGEIGRAQAMQAAACKIDATVDMNPVLLKPTSHVGSQVIVRGKPIGNMKATEYYAYKSSLFSTVKESVKRLMSEYDLVIIEGAGSPAEVNLKKHDIVNMRIARLLHAPVVLVGDIDCGGVFAWLLGTLMLLTKKEQSLVKGFIINKFRGDKRLLTSGLRYLERKSSKKVFGVVPYYTDIQLPEEDSLFFDQYAPKKKDVKKCVHIAVIKLPHIANFTDFDVLVREDDVVLEYTRDSDLVAACDCIIIPGSKNTLEDVAFLHASGLAEAIVARAQSGCSVIGICGGFQMLGKYIVDEHAVESRQGKKAGLALLPVVTHFEDTKKTFQVTATHCSSDLPVTGYEIHHGKTKRLNNCNPCFTIVTRGDSSVTIRDGARNAKGNIWGTYIHGVFDAADFRRAVIAGLRKKKGLKDCSRRKQRSLDTEFDRLADLLRDNIDMPALEKIIFS